MSSLDPNKSKKACKAYQKAERTGTLKLVEEIDFSETIQGQTVETFIEFLTSRIKKYEGTQLYIDTIIHDLCPGMDLVEIAGTK